MRGSPLLVGLLAASRACGCFALLAVVSTRLLQVCRGPPVPHLGGPQLHTTYARRTACGRRAPQISRSGAVCATPDRALARPASVRSGGRPHDRQGGHVSQLPSPSAARLPRPRWLDPRLVAGVLLVLLSVVVGARVFAAADERVDVWAVTHDLGADSRLTDGDLSVRAVRLDDVAARYVAADQDLRGRVLTRSVGRGELLPVAAVAKDAGRPQRRVVVEVDRLGAGGLAKGRVVDVYSVRDPSGGTGAGSGDGSGPAGGKPA